MRETFCSGWNTSQIVMAFVACAKSAGGKLGAQDATGPIPVRNCDTAKAVGSARAKIVLCNGLNLTTNQQGADHRDRQLRTFPSPE